MMFNNLLSPVELHEVGLRPLDYSIACHIGNKAVLGHYRPDKKELSTLLDCTVADLVISIRKMQELGFIGESERGFYVTQDFMDIAW